MLAHKPFAHQTVGKFTDWFSCNMPGSVDGLDLCGSVEQFDEWYTSVSTGPADSLEFVSTSEQPAQQYTANILHGHCKSCNAHSFWQQICGYNSTLFSLAIFSLEIHSGKLEGCWETLLGTTLRVFLTFVPFSRTFFSKPLHI